MKDITISLDDETYRRVHVIATERGTSVSALVTTHLEKLGSGMNESERLRQVERELRQRVGEFRAAGRLGRDELHRRRHT
ncbi:MAG TPA: DUF6364 family protein [Steroidobacteraceae bacterium]|nr:DUF6364 family protein [Steroidobacteraceae bacterium]